jgi:uncharacterized repeat protein (TIGR01451 family)
MIGLAIDGQQPLVVLLSQSRGRSLLALISLFWLLGGWISPSAQAQTVLIEEEFSGTTANPNWTSGIGSDVSEFPCLTSAPPNPNNPPPNPGSFPTQQPLAGCPVGTLPDPAGNGVLRLTSINNNQAGFVFFRQPLPAGSGLIITFDIFQYGGTGADGISFFLVDGTQPEPTRAGAFGGSLGYAQRDGVPGLRGGYVGIGFDAFGNYANPTESRVGGDGFLPNFISLRGSEAIQYRYLGGVAAPIFSPANNTRALARRGVRVIVTPNSQITVELDTGSGFIPVISNFDLASIPGQGPLPSQIIFGFAGSTGAVTNFNEIRDFRVTTLAPDLSLSKTSQGNFTVGTPGVYTLTVQNSPAAGQTLGAIRVTDTLPDGFQFVAATGTNWNCTATGQQVTCTYNGSAAPGETLPSISLTVLPTAIAASVENVATVTTPGDTDLSNNTGQTRTTVIGPADPVLRLVKRITAIRREGSPLAGVDFSQFVNDPASPNDDSLGWLAFPPIGIFQLGDDRRLRSGDEIEYTLYVLSEGGSPARNVTVCDQIPLGTQLVPNSAQIQIGTNPTASGGQIFSSLAPLPNGNPCANPINPNGSVIFNFGDVPNTSPENVGFGRFRVRVE